MLYYKRVDNVGLWKKNVNMPSQASKNSQVGNMRVYKKITTIKISIPSYKITGSSPTVLFLSAISPNTLKQDGFFFIVIFNAYTIKMIYIFSLFIIIFISSV